MQKIVIYGKQPVMEALKSSYKIYQIWYSNDINEKLVKYIKNLADKKDILLKPVSKNEIQKLTGPVVHQGLAVEMEALTIKSQTEIRSFIEKNPNPFLVILDQVQDPHNMGAILRTAEICGAHAVIMPEKGSAKLNDTVAKTSAGAIFHLKIFVVDALEKCIEELNNNGVATLALMPGSENAMYKKNLSGSLAIIVGSEGPGVRKNIANICSDKISIPQYGKIESLNASVATAIVLYEVVRQRNI